MKSIVRTIYVSRPLGIVSDKGFLGGVALSIPFYMEFFSWRWALVLAIPFFLCCLVRREKVGNISLEILPAVLLLVLHVIALAFSDTPFSYVVIKDLLIALFLLGVYLLTNKNMLTGFFVAILPLAVATAVLGLVKVAMLEQGWLVYEIFSTCDYYPPGSSLCVNYNNLGFFWLIAVLGCIKIRAWWCIPVLLAAGVFLTSRRFLVLMIFIPWIMILSRHSIVRTLSVVIVSAGLVCSVLGASSVYNVRAGADSKIYSLIEMEEKSVVKLYLARSNPSVILSTMMNSTLGTASRLDLWKMGIKLVSWYPQGWVYHKIFSCEFSSCADFHYPHASLISEWIIGGFLFFLVACMFYLLPLWVVWKDRNVIPIAMLLFAMPYMMLSGDTVFSLPGCLSCMFLALSTTKNDRFNT